MTLIQRRLIRVCAGIALGSLLVASDAAAQTGAPVFSDDFSTSALLAEQWKVSPPERWKIKDGVFSVSPDGSAFASPKTGPVSGPIEVTCRVKCLGFDKKGGWCGVKVRGILFTLQPGGFWFVYYVKDQKRALGELEKTNPPVPGQWYDFRIVQKDNSYTWFVDGRKVADFVEPNAIIGKSGGASLATSGPGMAYDNFSVSALPANENTSPNFIRNASFEVVHDHVPIYWKPWGVSTVPPELFWANWRVDESEASDGKQSVRIVSSKGSGAGFFSHDSRMAVGQPCTYSVFLKASKPGLKAELVYWEFLGRWSKKPIQLGTEWKRYSFTLEHPEKMRVRGGLRIWGDGVVWADAAQLESGTNATPYRLCALDEPSTVEGEPAKAVQPPYTLAQSAVAPKLDGKLDDKVWRKARAWDLVPTGSDDPVQATETHMLLSGNVLYIGMLCHDDTIGDLQRTATEHDTMVFRDDCVELFLDTNHDRSTYYQLAVNALGTRFDTGPGRNMAWSHTWEAKTHVGDSFWSVEIAIPLASLDITSMTASTWGVNLCRNHQKYKEISSTALNNSPNFHCPELYPVINWPDGAFTDSMLYPQKLAVAVTTEGTLALTGALVNRTGETLSVVLSGDCDGVTWSAPALRVADGDRTPLNVNILERAETGKSEVQISGVIKAETTGAALREFSGIFPVVRSSDPAPVAVTPGPYTSGIVPIDPKRRCLMVDGQPFFVVAPLLSLHPNTKRRAIDLLINHHADNGYRSVMVVGKIDQAWCDAAWSHLFAACLARNVRIVAWPGGFRTVPAEVHVAFINKWKAHPMLIAWLPVDEPELYATAEDTQAHIALYKKTDPNHPVYVNNTCMGIPGRFAGLPGDIISIDDYLTNREGRHVKEIVRQVDMMEAAAIPTHRPTWMFISGNNLHNHNREPLPGEQVAQSYGCAIAGANGLLYFLGNPAGRQHWLALRQINRELMDLGPVLLSVQPAPDATCSAPELRFTTRRLGSQVYLMAVNLEARDCGEVRFAVAGFDGKAAVVLFEDRLVTVSDGVITDRFGPHERHVYRLSMPQE